MSAEHPAHETRQPRATAPDQPCRILVISRNKWIPHPCKPEALKILDVGGGELRDAERPKAKGGAGVVNPAPGNAWCAGSLPQLSVKRGAVWRKAKRLPSSVLPVALNDGDGFGGGERSFDDRRIAKEKIKFGEDKFAEPNILTHGHRLDEIPSVAVMR